MKYDGYKLHSFHFVAFLFCATSLFSAEPVGIVASIRGPASVFRVDQTEQVVTLQMPLYEGDRIESGFDAAVQLLFADGSKVQLAGSSDLTISKYHYDKDREEPVSELSIENGAFSFMVGEIKQVAPENYKIETAFATLGIRGSSGEVQTSNGSLPGVPANLVVRKTGGEGLLADFPGSDSPLEMSETGAGILVQGPPGTPPENRTFSGSLITHYKQNSEARVAEGRAAQRVDQVRDSDEAMSEVEAAPSSLGGEGSLTEAVEPRPTEDEVAAALEEGDATDGRRLGGGAQVVANEDRAENTSSPASPAVIAPPERSADTVSAFRFDSSQVTSVKRGLQQVSELATEGRQSRQAQETVRAEGIAVSGAIGGLRYDEALTTLHTTVTGRIYPDKGYLSASMLDPEEGFSIYPGEEVFGKTRGSTHSFPSGGQSSNQAANSRSDFDSEIERTFIIDRRGEFITGHQWRLESRPELLAFHIGIPSSSGQLPTSGVRYYASDQDSSSLSAGLWTGGALLIENDAVSNPGFTALAVANFRTKRVGVLTRPPDFLLTGPQNPGPGEACSLDSDLPAYEPGGYAFFTGTIRADGTIQDGRLYRQMGFLPTHVQLPGDDLSSTVDYGFSSTSLSGFSGSGRFYGSTAQAFGISLGSQTGNFVAGLVWDEDPHSIQSTSGTYSGNGIGISVAGSEIALESLSDLTLLPEFSRGSMTGAFTVDGEGDVTFGERALAVERDVAFADLTSAEEGSLAVGVESSFLITLPLPEVVDHQNNVTKLPSDVMWGTWNIVTSDPTPIIYPGLHNIWLASIATPISSGGTVTTKLGASSSLVHYRGVAIQVLVDPGQHHFALSSLPSGPGWRFESFSQVDPGGTAGLIDGSSYSGAIARTVTPEVNILVDFDETTLRGILYGGSESVTLLRVQAGDLDEHGYSGALSTIHLTEDNVSGDLFAMEWSESGSIEGGWAGTAADSQVFQFARSSVHSAKTELQLGGGVATQVTSTEPDQVVYWKAYFHGVRRDTANAVHQLLNQPDISGHFVVYPSGGVVGGGFDTDGGADYFELIGGDFNVVISKDSFFSTIDDDSGVVLESAGASYSLDPAQSFVVALPGLEAYDYINWGRWRARPTSGDVRHFGYWAGGRRADATAEGMIPDVSAIAASNNPIVHYSGVAIGTLYDGIASENRVGSCSMNVNFNSAAVSGAVDLGSQAKVALSGTLNAADASFSGTAMLNGNSSDAGNFFGGCFYDEASGTFGAADGTKAVAGSFGAKADRTIPQKQRDSI